MPETIWSVIRLILQGDLLSGLALLREQIAAREYHAAQKHARQIARVEEVFRVVARCEPWPADLQRRELIFWRGKLGMLLEGLPLPVVLDDLKATAAGKGSLLYYLSSERGQRASRWEMLLCDRREKEWEEEKRQEAEDAKRFFSTDEGGRMRDELAGIKTVEPQWVMNLKKERDHHRWLIEQDVSVQRKRGAMDRIEQIAMILEKHGFGEG